MYWIATDLIKAGMLLVFSFFVLSLFVPLVARNVFRVDVAYVMDRLSKSKIGAVLLLVLVGLTAGGIDELYAAVHPHHLHFTDRIEWYNPYVGYHYYPSSDDAYCTKEGDRISKEEALRQFDETHDLERDSEGNVIATYPKGEGPAPTREDDSPYYVFNMSEEQANAYADAKGICGNVRLISKARLYKRLTDPDDRYRYSHERASFAIEALEQNGFADWTAFCIESASNMRANRADVSRGDMYNWLTEDKEYTPEEAEIALDYAFSEES